jgi:hypothetical protein
MDVPAYGAEEVCNHYVIPDGAHMLDITSHTHKRGKRFRIWEGKFACVGGPNDGEACTPFGPDPNFPVADLCSGHPCQDPVAPSVGDCDGDMRVTVEELVLGVRMALGAPESICPAFAHGRPTIVDLVRAVHDAISPPGRDPVASLFYVSLTYADPLVLNFDPSRLFAPIGASETERTITYCALWDNGFTVPEEVERNSRRPSSALPCVPTHCAEGDVGVPCAGSSSAERDASCDSAPGAGDGFCDACSAGRGSTTDDEMFVMIGSYYQE